MMSWLRNLIFRKHANDNLAEEIREHIAERTEQLIAQSRSPEDAAREARRAFGNPTLARERSVEVWQWRWLENLWADLRFALHQLAKSPGYTVTAILTLAIGIGANAAIFTLIDDIMLRSLPVSHPEQLVEIGFRSQPEGYFIEGLSEQSIHFLASNTSSLQSLSGWVSNLVFVADDRGTLRSVPAAMLTGDGFSTMRVRPYLGRLLQPEDDIVGGPEGGWPVVISYGFWQQNFQREPTIVGRHLRVSGQPAVVVGVLPPEFSGLYGDIPQKLFLPAHIISLLAGSPEEDPYRSAAFFLPAIGRLRDGATVAQLNAELAVGSSAFRRSFVLPAKGLDPSLHTATLEARRANRGFPFLQQQYRHPLLLLQAVVGLVLLLCCLNLAGLQITRMFTREHEFAVRSALGSGRGRIVQQCLTESLLLAFLGSALATVLAWTSTGALGRLLTPAGALQTTVIHPNAYIFILSTTLALLTTLLFGLTPALGASRVSPATLLKSKGVQQRTAVLRRFVFVPLQFALSLVLVLGAGLLVQTLLRLNNTSPGFDPSHTMTVESQFQYSKKTPGEIATLYRAMINSLRSASGIQAVSAVWTTPLYGFAHRARVHSLEHARVTLPIAWNEVGDGYFSTMKTALLAGREFSSADRDRTFCILNESAAHAIFPAGAALGNALSATDNEQNYKNLDAICHVVGIVADAHYESLHDPAPPTIYFPICSASFHGSYSNNETFLIRASTDATAVAAFRAVLARYAPTTGVVMFHSLRDQVYQSLSGERILALLSTTFAAIALLLSGIGIFGLLALRVQERTPEIGIRIAVGATRGNLLLMILTEALRMVAIGSAAGLALAVIGYFFVRGFLYGASPADITLALASLLVLIVVALVAAAIPARRAAWLDPTQALRTK